MKKSFKLLALALAVIAIFFAARYFLGDVFLSDFDDPTDTASADTAFIIETEDETDDPGSRNITETEEIDTGVPDTVKDETETPQTENRIDENGVYTHKDDVALYIHTYGKLPSNFITKKEAEKLGWSGGGLDKIAKGKCIGGDHFGNYEGLLPKKKGREYTECDIDTLGAKSRGAKRIIFSNDGLIYYTDDHYESFELLYGND